MSFALAANPVVTFAITCRKQRRLLSSTIPQIERCGLRRDEFEILVVNRNDPDPSEAIGKRFPLIQMMVLADNPRLKSMRSAFAAARGRYFVMLDDDSYPRPGAIARMMTHFERNPNLGAAVFTLTRPDGQRDQPPFPNLVSRAGAAFRRRMIDPSIIPHDMLSPTAEYELSLRLLANGWEIRSCDDLHATHEVDPDDCESQDVRRGVRDGLVVLTRFFPQKWILPFARDWARRQRYAAADASRRKDYYKGLIAGLARAMSPRNRKPIDARTFESLVRLSEVETRLREAQQRAGIKRMVLVDYAPNLLAFYIAARKCGIEIAAIADQAVGAPHRSYRGIPVLPDHEAARLEFDAAIVTEMAPAQARARLGAWRLLSPRPVLDLFEAPPEPFTFAAGQASEYRQTAARSA